MDKKRKISSVMEPYIRNVLERDKIPYRSTVKNDGFVFYMPLTNRQFTEVLEDALCEKQRSESKSRIPVYSARTLLNREKRSRLMNLNGKQCFHILRADIETFENSYLV